MAKRSPATTSQTKEEVGFRPEHARSGGQRRAAQTRTDDTGKRVYIAPTIPDPGIQHGPFKVLQRTDGPWIVIDERRPPGDRTVETFGAKKARGGGEPPVHPKQEAELRAIALAKEVEGHDDDRIHEGGTAGDLRAPLSNAAPAKPEAPDH